MWSLKSVRKNQAADLAIAPNQLRRNSSIELTQRGKQRLVQKRYFKTHSIQDERGAYQTLESLLEGLEGLRAAKLHESVNEADTLLVEYIAGPTLAEQLAQGDIRGLNQHMNAICRLLAAAKHRATPFDCDPSNMIVSDGQIVMIDPLVMPLPIPHLSAAIFLQGFIKAGLRCLLRRPGLLGALFNAAHRVLGEYATLTGVSEGEVLGDLAKYQTQVIHWNREHVQAESRLHWVTRQIFLVPVYYAIRYVVLWQSKRRNS